MKKSILLTLLILTILMIAIGCTKTKDINTNEKEITVVMSNFDKYSDSYKAHLDLFISEFFKETGYKVNILKTQANNQDEYIANRNTELYLQEGPTLILVGNQEEYKNLVEQGVGLEVGEKIANYNNIYDSLKDGYFVPIGMGDRSYLLNKAVLEELGIEEPNLDWTIEDLRNINYKWYEERNVHMSMELFSDVIDFEISYLEPLLNENGRSELANKETVETIEDIREKLMYSGLFRLNENYTYENYYNMIFLPQSKERIESRELFLSSRKEDFIVLIPKPRNSLNAIEMSRNNFKTEEILVLPTPSKYLYYWGFLVNKNGKNIEMGLKFLDKLLSDEAQLKLYTSELVQNRNTLVSFSGPVVSTIEDDIKRIEKQEKIEEHLIELREETLKQIKNGERVRLISGTQEEYLKNELIELIAKIVFSDEKYISEEIIRELKDLDNRMNLMFNE